MEQCLEFTVDIPASWKSIWFCLIHIESFYQGFPPDTYCFSKSVFAIRHWNLAPSLCFVYFNQTLMCNLERMRVSGTDPRVASLLEIL